MYMQPEKDARERFLYSILGCVLEKLKRQMNNRLVNNAKI